MKRIIAAVLVVSAYAATAAAQCSWVPLSTTIYTDCPVVGIGTSTPGVLLSNSSANINDGSTGLSMRSISWHTTAVGYTVGIENAGNDLYAHGLLVKTNSTHPAIALHAMNGTSSLLAVRSNGFVGINKSNPSKALDVVGDAHFEGTVTGRTIYAHYQDVAELVPSTETIPAGTVVVLDPHKSNHVLPSSSSYDPTVAGVVSPAPGLLLGKPENGNTKVATFGRVRVRVDATSSPIRIGDALVTSTKPGMAMRSQPIDVGGVQIHRPGTLIGKALEPLPSGEGEILVLLSMQ